MSTRTPSYEAARARTAGASNLSILLPITTSIGLELTPLPRAPHGNMTAEVPPTQARNPAPVPFLSIALREAGSCRDRTYRYYPGLLRRGKAGVGDGRRSSTVTSICVSDWRIRQTISRSTCNALLLAPTP